MRRLALSVLLPTAVLTVGSVAYAMTFHDARLYIEGSGKIRCEGWVGYADTDRTVSVWLRDPSGSLLAFSTAGAQHAWERPWAVAQVSLVGSGTYTCEVHFEEFGPGAAEDYDQMHRQLEVE